MDKQQQNLASLLASKNASPHRLYWLALVLALLAPLALWIDLPVARTCIQQHGMTPHAIRKIVDLHKLLALSEVFAHGIGVVLIISTVLVLDPARRLRDALRLFVCSLGAGITADVVKLFVGRTRPNAFDFEGGIVQTFVGWAPLLTLDNAGEALSRNIQSFPSAHTATAFGLAVALGWLYPRGRALFFAFAILAAIQRIDAGAHYVSDTLAAAALGCLAATLSIDSRRWPARFFDRFERRGQTLSIRRAASQTTADVSPAPDVKTPAA